MKIKILFSRLSIVLLFFISYATNAQSKNTYEMTEEKAESYGMPPVAFTVNYPDSIIVEKLEDSYDESNYINFITKKRDATLSIGSLYRGELNRDNHTLDNTYLYNLIDQIADAYSSARPPNYKVHFMGKKDFSGQKLYQFECSYDITDEETQETKTWRDKIVLLPNNSSNGVIIIFQANNRYKYVKSFSDLGKKGVLSSIWSSFQFTEN